MADELLVVDDLKKHFPVTRGIIFQKQVAAVKAVDGVSFTRQPRRDARRRRRVGLRQVDDGALHHAPARADRGRDRLRRAATSRRSRAAEMRPIRREMMMIFQDPYASLNPRKRVGFIVGEALEVHKIGTDGEIKRRVQELLEVVGLNPEHYNRFPHEFSGRPAPAHRRRARARGQPEADRLRRARLGARRLGAGADPQPAQGPAGRVRAHLHLHRARPQRRPAHLRPRDGHVPRQGRGDRRPRRALRASRSIRTRARCSRRCPMPDPELGRPRKQIVLEGDVPNPINPPAALPLPPALPALPRGRLRRRRAGAATFGGTGTRRVPLPARVLADDARTRCGRPPRRRRRPSPSYLSAVLRAASAASSSCSSPPGSRRRGVSLALGLLLGASIGRSVSVGLYLVGCFLLVAGLLRRQPRAGAARGRRGERWPVGGMFGNRRGAVGDGRRARGGDLELGDLRRRWGSRSSCSASWPIRGTAGLAARSAHDAAMNRSAFRADRLTNLRPVRRWQRLPAQL